MVLQIPEPGRKWDVMVDLLFYREPEDPKEQIGADVPVSEWTAAAEHGTTNIVVIHSDAIILGVDGRTSKASRDPTTDALVCCVKTDINLKYFVLVQPGERPFRPPVVMSGCGTRYRILEVRDALLREVEAGCYSLSTLARLAQQYLRRTSHSIGKCTFYLAGYCTQRREFIVHTLSDTFERNNCIRRGFNSIGSGKHYALQILNLESIAFGRLTEGSVVEALVNASVLDHSTGGILTVIRITRTELVICASDHMIQHLLLLQPYFGGESLYLMTHVSCVSNRDHYLDFHYRVLNFIMVRLGYLPGDSSRYLTFFLGVAVPREGEEFTGWHLYRIKFTNGNGERFLQEKCRSPFIIGNLHIRGAREFIFGRRRFIVIRDDYSLLESVIQQLKRH